VNDTAPLGYSSRVSSLFRRKSPDVATSAVSKEEVPDTAPRPKSYTPSKKELGVATPKRGSNARRVTEAAPANRREAMKQMRERQRLERAEQTAGMKAGDERYLLARDRGPERALVRDIIDSRRTVGTWFFGGALIVLVGSTVRVPAIQLASNLLWAVLAIGVIVDSLLIARKVKGLALTFRRMRVPKPRVQLGDKL
jgi:hypothetical protein